MKCYMFRHQVAGIVTTHVFLKEPTAEQLAPLIAECTRLHGTVGWGSVHEAELLDGEIPSLPSRAAAGGHGLARVEVSAQGTVA